MATTKKSNTTSKQRKATTPEARENQMISLAVDLAEQQLRDGTASPSVITHFLKLGSTREEKEQQILGQKAELMLAQTESIKSGQRVEALYAEALNAIRTYSGQPEVLDE